MGGVVEMVHPVVAMARRPVQRRRNAERLRQGSPAAIRQEGFRNVNGVEQWVTVRGQDRTNPLLLLVHGGPGSSYTPFNAWLTDWERHFTLVQWDQPGAGRTFQRAGRTGPADLTLDALAGHGIELVRQLCADLGHRRVILLGSSVGSVIGLLMARRHPELFAAYVGTNQNAPGGEREAYRLVLRAARERGDRRGLRLLERIGPEPSAWTGEQRQDLDKAAIRVTTGVPDMVADLMLPALMYDPRCTFADLRDYQRAMSWSMHRLHPQLQAVDLAALGHQAAVPVCFVHGAADIITPLEPVRRLAAGMRAPHVDLAVVDGAGHLVEFARSQQVLTELVSRVRPYAVDGPDDQPTGAVRSSTATRPS